MLAGILNKVEDSEKNPGLIRIPVGMLQTNCYIFWDRLSREAIIIDPGDEPENILEFIIREKLNLIGIVNTHGHADHIGANHDIRSRTSAPLSIHPADREMLTDPRKNMSLNFGLTIVSPPADSMLLEGAALSIGPWNLTIRETPGHSPGSICLLGEGMLFSGDTLFSGSIGRTDIPGGDSEQLLESIRRRILPLPPETLVFPGHGPSTTLEKEKSQNPFLVND
ncbi:MBL fold metallo-hydrolase [bacterium]|nr:MBL fold metallo-hydrolase [bacterium]